MMLLQELCVCVCGGGDGSVWGRGVAGRIYRRTVGINLLNCARALLCYSCRFPGAS